jgi:phage terminase large subunit GpA-like protein
MTGATSKRTLQIFRRARQIGIPLTTLTVSAWAETYRHLPSERADQSGRWRNEVTPYLTGIMDTVGQPGVREIVFIASTQVGKTEFLNNVIGYFVHIEPSPILYLCETQDKATAWSKECLAPTIRDTPVLSALFGPVRARDSGNTIEEKSFPGGHLATAWATSATTLSSRPRRVILMDERDAYESTKEGDPVALAEERAVTFRDRKVIIKASTPRNRLEPEPGAPLDAPRYTQIEWEYENTDKRKFYVPCPHCDEYQVLKWRDEKGNFNIRWPDDNPLAAFYVCLNGCVIENESKQEMLLLGEWRAEKPFAGRAGFHIWAAYSPFVTFGEIAAKWIKAKKSQAALKVFVNTTLAEGWQEYLPQELISDLAARREPFEADVPEGVLAIVASADVQGDRIETEIVGFGLDDETWSLRHEVIVGDPAGQQVWRELKELWTTPLERADGTEMRVMAACVDSGGHHTQEVYKFCRENAGRRWFAVKGANTPGKPLVTKPTLQGRPPVRLYIVGTETAKDTIAAHLGIAKPGPGYCHFPVEREEDYFRQLRSERPVVHTVGRKSVRQWEKIKPGVRNEALDLRVYAMAAIAIIRPDFKRLQRQLAEQAAAPQQQIESPEPEVEEQAEELRAQRARGRRGRGGFVNRW